jgi:hypothetical protein
LQKEQARRDAFVERVNSARLAPQPTLPMQTVEGPEVDRTVDLPAVSIERELGVDADSILGRLALQFYDPRRTKPLIEFGSDGRHAGRGAGRFVSVRRRFW